MIRSVLVVLGVIFLVIACVYWLVPAGSLPGFMPGFEAGVPRVHVKHGVAALVVAAVCFIVAWFVGRSQLGRLRACLARTRRCVIPDMSWSLPGGTVRSRSAGGNLGGRDRSAG